MRILARCAFDVARAYEHVEPFSQEPHPSGSDGAERIRDYVFDELQSMGLQPQLQETVGAGESLGGPAMASVRNIVAVISGTNSSGRVFLSAHTDSTPLSYDASDDAVGIATLVALTRTF